MKFRTEIGKIESSFSITHDDRVVMLGSCFADNVGSLLERDGFNVVHNPLGPLFNPKSIDAVLARRGKPFTKDDFVCIDGRWHCLWFANRYQADTSAELADMVNRDYLPLHEALSNATVIILTFGTNRVFEYGEEKQTACNCHKIVPSFFSERFIEPDEVAELYLAKYYPRAKRILTLSPVRYPGQGLPSAFLSKAVLRVAIERICKESCYNYFPAFEIVNDDLRDYRFYAPDMRHPSETAVEYIYQCFSETYFSDSTIRLAEDFRRKARRSAHIPFA